MNNSNVLKNSSLLNSDINPKVIGFYPFSFVFKRDRSYHLRRSCPIECKYIFDGSDVICFGYRLGRIHHFNIPIYG